MTCSSDPENVFASLASLKALSANFGAGNSVCERVCVFACFQVVLHLNKSFKITACQRWVWGDGSNNKHKLCLEEKVDVSTNVQYISVELESRDTSCSLFALLPPLQAVVFNLFVFPPVSQSVLADLALTWPRKQKIRSFLTLSTKFTPPPLTSLAFPGALNLLTTIDRTANYSRKVEGDEQQERRMVKVNNMQPSLGFNSDDSR